MIKEVNLDVCCPFYYTIVYDDDGWGASDSMCAFLEAECCGLGKKECPLKNDSVLVQKKTKSVRRIKNEI